MRHIIKAQQFDRSMVEHFFERADYWRNEFERGASPPTLSRHLIYLLFYEPSTRTRFSFETAAHRLGMRFVSTENARDFSSAIKGESLEDTARVLSQYRPSAIIVRHYETGATERMANVSSCPIINAGDGSGQHPTQAMLDVYTIWRELGRLDDLNVVIGGDLAHGRTARSLSYVLSKFNKIKLVFVSPPALRMGDDILQHLNEHNINHREEVSLEKAIDGADVIYWTRIQKERLPEELQNQAQDLQHLYTIDERITAALKPNSIILHPLPRLTEISTAIDNDPRAAYFRQAGNGVWIRMALLEWVLEDQ